MVREKSAGFLLAIGQDMGILPDKRESEDHYAERVILSAGAKWMLTAVHNENMKASVESVKKTAQEKMESCLEIIDRRTLDVRSIVECMYDTLLANGMFYHEQYNVRPVPRRDTGFREISLVRGMLPEENVRFSGMAPYIPGGGTEDPAEAFMLWRRDGKETLHMAWMRGSPQNRQVVIGEYLNADYQSRQKYFDPKRHDQADITLGRTRRNDSYAYDYYLIRGSEIRRIPDDYVIASVHGYVMLAIVNGQKKQKVSARIGRELVLLELGYLLPKADTRFLRFVSWPYNLETIADQRFRFCLHPLVWPAVRERLEFLGFSVEEQHE